MNTSPAVLLIPLIIIAAWAAKSILKGIDAKDKAIVAKDEEIASLKAGIKILINKQLNIKED